MRIGTILVVFCFVLMLASSALAAIDITNNTGTISIKMPDGQVITVTAGQKLPDVIPDGAVITVVSGTANISNSGTSTVLVSIAGSTIQLAPGTKVNLALDAAGTAKVTVTSGQAAVTNGDISAALDTGDSVNLISNFAAGACFIELLKGVVPVTLLDGKITNLDTTNPRIECKPIAEPFTAAVIPNTTNAINTVIGNETSRDISPTL